MAGASSSNKNAEEVPLTEYVRYFVSTVVCNHTINIQQNKVATLTLFFTSLTT